MCRKAKDIHKQVRKIKWSYLYLSIYSVFNRNYCMTVNLFDLMVRFKQDWIVWTILQVTKSTGSVLKLWIPSKQVCFTETDVVTSRCRGLQDSCSKSAYKVCLYWYIYENKSSFTILLCFGKLELEDWRTRKLTVRYNDNNSTQSSLYVVIDR